MTEWESLKERFAGKWQIPLLGVSLALFAAAVLRLNPGPERLPVDEVLGQIEAQLSAGVFGSAVPLGDGLLARKDLTQAQTAKAHLLLGRARYGLAEMLGRPTASAANQIVAHYQEAVRGSVALDAADHWHLGRAFEWRSEYARAVEHYEEAVARGVDHAHEVEWHILDLKLHRLDTPPSDAIAMLDAFLGALPDERLDLRIWAIERELDALDALGRQDAASTLLERNRARFQDSTFQARFRYLEALVLYDTGQFDEAETLLRTVRNQLEPSDDVYAMSGWLLGRVVLSDGGPGRPQEALSFFADVIRWHPRSAFAVASRVGSAEALAMLERHDEALAAYRVAMEELDASADPYPVDVDALRASLGVTAEIQRQAERFAEAIEYTKLAVSLVDRGDVEIASLYSQQLAQLQFQQALRIEGMADTREPARRPQEAASEQGRRLFAAAAATYAEVARLNALNERRAAEAAWWAAELSARAGQREHATQLYLAFASERPQNPLVPRALLRVGQLRQASGAYEAAVDTYRECYRRFPRTLEGSRTLVPLAECYLALGPNFEDLAEKTLRIVLEDSEVFTPAAGEFADAMFLLGDVLSRRGNYERAIAELEETIERYPGDPRVWQAKFLLAGAYRKSGLALKSEAEKMKNPRDIERTRAEMRSRFRAAGRMYRDFITRLEGREPSSLSPLERTYARHAHFYEADCLFEIQEYEQALTLYEQAAGVFKDTPSALSAYVQIINSNVFLGRLKEARAALARAKVLVDAMPDEVFAASLSPETRDDWKRYFAWLDQAGVF